MIAISVAGIGVRFSCLLSHRYVYVGVFIAVITLLLLMVVYDMWFTKFIGLFQLEIPKCLPDSRTLVNINKDIMISDAFVLADLPVRIFGACTCFQKSLSRDGTGCEIVMNTLSGYDFSAKLLVHFVSENGNKQYYDCCFAKKARLGNDSDVIVFKMKSSDIISAITRIEIEQCSNTAIKDDFNEVTRKEVRTIVFLPTKECGDAFYCRYIEGSKSMQASASRDDFELKPCSE